MKFQRWCWLLVGVLFTTAESARAMEALAEPVKGTLVIIGGSERFDFTDFWSEIVDLAGGKGASFAVLPTASGNPTKNGNYVVDVLNKHGAKAFLVPLAWRKVGPPPNQIAHQAEWVEKVSSADGVFMIGGEQSRLTQALYDADGGNTPMLDAMWSVYKRGGVIAGTSAGAAVMSRVMYRDAESVLSTLLHGVKMGKEIDRGFGFIDAEWFIDQHCLVRGRFARAIVAMQTQNIKYGIGVDENSALVVRQGHEVKVIGYKGAIVIDLSEAEHNEREPRFNLKNIRLSYLDRGDFFDMKTRQVTPAKEKLEEDRIDPSSKDFKPFYKKPQFENDILGNTTVADLMGKLIDCKYPTAIGLAFDGLQAREKPVDGFEFKFIRDEDSVGWYTEAFGGDDYTVLNIRLDIRPVRFAGPLYE